MIIEIFSFKEGFTSKLPSFFLIFVTIYSMPHQPCSLELRWQSVCFCMCIDFSRGWPPLSMGRPLRLMNSGDCGTRRLG